MWKFIQQLPQRMARITSGGKIIKEIDGLRFLAIMPVLIQHMAERFERNTTINFVTPPENATAAFLASRGVIGVYIFFASW
jgi:peptidoglycan/LPS O-acetylase OafA/YrhL